MVGVIYFLFAAPSIIDLVLPKRDYVLETQMYIGMVTWLIVFAITMYLTFKKRRNAIHWNVGLIIYYALITFLMSEVYSELFKQTGIGDFFHFYLLSIIWVWYWFVSERVKNPFLSPSFIKIPPPRIGLG